MDYWAHLFKKASIEEYNIGLLKRPIGSFVTDPNVSQVHWIPKSWHCQYQADPFAFWKGENLYLFYERLRFGSRRGEIWYVTLDAQGQVGRPALALRQPVHLSYPFVLEDGGEIYMIPETAQAGEVALFRAVHFPDRWEKVQVLLKGVRLVDATPFFREGRWWLLGSLVEKPGAGPFYKLHGWFANSLRGPWTPHPLNPLSCDIHSSRPGGTPFVLGSVWYRPAQDCAPTYGCRTVLNRLDDLTPETFTETPAGLVLPQAGGPYPDGLHTLSSAGPWTFIDGFRRRPTCNPYKLASKACRRLAPPAPRAGNDLP